MAKSAVSKLYKGSVEPALLNTTNFIDQAVMNPEVMMRNPEERLLYHTRANQQLADQGLIERENLMAKAYVDAGQANNIVQGDLYDAYANARTRLDPSLQEQITLVNAGLPKDFIQGSMKAGERVVRKGNYDETITDYLTQTPNETTVINPATGEPNKRFSIGTTPSSQVTKRTPTPEYKANLKRGVKEKRSVVIKRTPMMTNEDVMIQDLGLLKSKLALSGYNTAEQDIINKVVAEAAMKNKSVEDAIANVQASVRTVDEETIAGITDTMNKYNARFDDYVVIGANGTPSMTNVRLDAQNQAEPIIMYGEGSGEGNTINLPRYVGRDNKRFLAVPTNHGPVLMEADYVNNKKEAMKRNYAASRKNGEQILFDVDPESLVVLNDSKVDPEGGGVISYKAEDNSRVNGAWLARHKVLNNSDPDYTAQVRKDIASTKALLSSGGIIDNEGALNNGHPAVESIKKKLDTSYDKDKSLGGLGSLPDSDFNTKPIEEQEALIKLDYLRSKQPGMAHMFKLRDGKFDVNLNTASADYLSKKDRGGGSRQEMLVDAGQVVQDKPITLVTPEGEAIPIEYGAGLEDGKVKLFAPGPNGALISVSGKRNSDKYTVQKQIGELGEKLIGAYGDAGLIDPNSKAGIGKKTNTVPKGGHPRD